MAASIMPAAVQRNAIAAPELYRQAEAVDGQHLVESFEDAGGDTGRLLIKPAGEIAQQPLGFIGIADSTPGA